MKNILIAGALLLGVSTASPELQAADFDQKFDGTWIGTIRIIDTSLYNPMKLPAGAPQKPLEFAIEIDGGAARVSFNAGSGWTEAKPGAFSIISHKTNAVVLAIDSYIAPDESIGWVETWNFTLTHKEDESLYAYWVRSVNNFAIPAMTDPNARFFVSGFGELAKSQAITGAGRVSVAEKIERARSCSPLQISCDNDAIAVHSLENE